MSQPYIILAHQVRTAIGAYSCNLKGVPLTRTRGDRDQGDPAR